MPSTPDQPERKLPALPKDGALGLIQYTGADMHRYARQAQAEQRAQLTSDLAEAVEALQEALDYLSCIPESAVGGDDDAAVIARRARSILSKHSKEQQK